MSMEAVVSTGVPALSPTHPVHPDQSCHDGGFRLFSGRKQISFRKDDIKPFFKKVLRCPGDSRGVQSVSFFELFDTAVGDETIRPAYVFTWIRWPVSARIERLSCRHRRKSSHLPA